MMPGTEPYDRRTLSYKLRLQEAVKCYLLRNGFMQFKGSDTGRYLPKGASARQEYRQMSRLYKNRREGRHYWTWLPNQGERRPCCDSITAPHENNPDSLANHCNTYKHIANLYNVSLSDLKKQAKTEMVLQRLTS